MICEYGVGRYLDLVDAIRPAVLFANAREARLLDVTRPQFAKTMVVVKDGARATTVLVPGDAAADRAGAAGAGRPRLDRGR